MADKIKFALALVLLVAGVVGFYLLAEQAMVLRVLSVIAGSACCGRGVEDEPGQRFAVSPRRRSPRRRKSSGRPARNLADDGIVFAFVVIMAVSCG
jgi:preprotein translocase subunit SecE